MYGHGDWKKNRSSRTIVRSTELKDAEKRVAQLERRGFVRVNGMDVVEDVGYMGDTSYVCVMEYKKKPLD